MSDVLMAIFIPAGMVWFGGAIIWAMHWSIEASGTRGAYRRSALQRAWLTPIWPVIVIPRAIPAARRRVRALWREAWADESPAAEPRRVRRSKQKPGQWEQPKRGGL
jgi:hypothetical protein